MKKIKFMFKKMLMFFINVFLGFFKIKKNRIVFEAGRGLVDGNAFAVYDYIINNCGDEFETIWLIDKGTDVSALKSGDYVYYRSLKSYYYLATAHYWIRNQSIGSLVKKKQGQVYIQLWHGNGALKHMGYDINHSIERPPVSHVVEWDYYIANDQLDFDHIKSSTGYIGKGDIIGMPCMDITLKYATDMEYKKKLLKKLGVNIGKKKIILYAPTFRDFDLDDGSVIDVPIKKLGILKDYVVFVRLHPLVRNKINKKIFDNDNIINVCNYPDISDILPIVDVLITDYSSVFYQFSPLNRPIIFYPYDMEKYVELRGGFYLDYNKDLPGPICYTEDEIVEFINNFNSNVYLDKIRDFNNKFNYLADGNACRRFVVKLKDGFYD